MAKKSSKKQAKKAAKKSVKKPSALKKTSAVKKNAFGVTPLGDRVVVRPIEAEDERTPSGIIIPDTAKKEKPSRGKVVAVGEGRRLENGSVQSLSVSVGDTVVFSKYGFDEVEVNGVEYLIVSESSILAVIEK